MMPTAYTGGLGIEVNKASQSDLSTFIKTDNEYFNDDKIDALRLGFEKTLILFDIKNVKLAYVATSMSGKNTELKDFNLKF